MPDLTIEQLQQQIEDLQRRNERLVENARAAAHRKLSFKVGDKGGAMIAGLGRFPLTLYYGQWKRIQPELPAFFEWLEEQKEAGNLALKPEEE